MTVSAVPVVPVETDALAPVREALLGLARRDADRVLAVADADARSTLARAAGEVEQITTTARAEAAYDAAELMAAERARAGRESRAVELRAQRAAYDALVRRAQEAVRALADEADVHERLAGLARARLGADAVVLRTPDGGVTAELGGRRISFDLAALADQAVADLLADREES
jgi:vacuolar-type H+-ATPase subunit E/Vma4